VYKDSAGIGKIVLSDDKGPIFEGKIGGSSPLFDELTQWAGLTSYVQYHGEAGTFSVPAEKIKVPMQTYERQSIPSETLARSFFVDPNLTRKIQERDGSLILTDGNRTVQIVSTTKGIRYSSTVPHERTPETANSDNTFQRGVAFINEHGGLQAPYIGKLVSSWAADRREYEFIEYRNGWPVYAGVTGIHISVAGNEVVEMNRNTLLLGMQMKEEVVEIEPPQKLLVPGIRNLYLAYAPKSVDSNRIQLVPVWVVEKRAGEAETYDALTGAIWQDSGEWSHGLE
jgi:regulatory protein YycH of two-component signal transduction system YycFG